MNLMRLAGLESLCSYDRLRELAEADKDGRLVVLPCKPDGSMLDTSDPETSELSLLLFSTCERGSQGSHYRLLCYSILLRSCSSISLCKL